MSTVVNVTKGCMNIGCIENVGHPESRRRRGSSQPARPISSAGKTCHSLIMWSNRKVICLIIGANERFLAALGMTI